MSGRKAKAIRRAAREQAAGLIRNGWKMGTDRLVRQPGNTRTALNHPDSFRSYYQTVKAFVKKGKIKV